MKSCWFLLLLTFALQLCSASSRYHSRPGSHHRVHHHGNHHHSAHGHRSNHQHRLRHYVSALNDKYGRKAPLLPPPAADSEEGGSTSEETRGLRGQSDALGFLQKSHSKCDVVGSYGIKGECSKYTDCAKAGLIPTQKFCPTGKFFDHLQRICVKSSDAQCKDVCKTEGEKLADPENPNGYLKCIKGVPMPFECENAEQSYNAKTEGCGSAEAEEDGEEDEDEEGEETTDDAEDGEVTDTTDDDEAAAEDE